jgi:hypothetical protein
MWRPRSGAFYRRHVGSIDQRAVHLGRRARRYEQLDLADPGICLGQARPFTYTTKAGANP